MTTKQAEEIKAAVDAGGWDALRVNPELNSVWQEFLIEARGFVNECVDVE